MRARRIAIAIAVAISFAAGSAIVWRMTRGPERSLANYCNAYQEVSTKLHRQWAARESQPTDSFDRDIAVMVTADDFVTFYSALDRVAPSEIRTDVGRALAVWKDMVGILGSQHDDPSMVPYSVQVVDANIPGVEQHVTDWTGEHCTYTV